MLKPCPFCGCEAVLVNEFFDDYLVMCSNSGCAVEGPLKATSDEAETAWNARSASTSRSSGRAFHREGGVMEDNSIKNMREYMVSDGKVDIDGTLFFCGNAILDLAARLDKLTERVGELELASPCPMLKSICEDWEYTGKVKKQPPDLTAGEFNRSE